MSFEIVTTQVFDKVVKKLSKKYPSFAEDLANFSNSLKLNPFQGVEISPGLRKIRLAITSKGRGKSGGARVITYTVVIAEDSGDVYMLDIYDKADYSSIDVEVIKQRLKDL